MMITAIEEIEEEGNKDKCEEDGVEYAQASLDAVVNEVEEGHTDAGQMQTEERKCKELTIIREF
jgi:hypothetical protein